MTAPSCPGLLGSEGRCRFSSVESRRLLLDEVVLLCPPGRVSELPLADPASAAELLIPDPLCIAAALWPDTVISASVQARVGVELGGSHCRGLTWVDRKAVGPAANVRIVTAVDMDVVRAALLRSVTEPRTDVG